MKQHGSESTIADLEEAAALQAEITHHRLALEWGQMVLTRAVQLWDYIESHETLAYEDKVDAQIHMLDEATGSLWRLHKVLAHTRRVLQQHRRNLRHQASSVDRA
jgi:23S rRNA maturation-related 3'-5' exoribonuclease YhaM